MGRKNDKRTRRTVSFYKVHYGFREPFKILLDGNFVHATQQAKNQSLQELLEKLLGAPCKLFTTKCVSHELKQLGDDFRPSFLLAKKQQLHKCAHETPISAADCLLQQIGSNNSDHWWIATQDGVLRQTLAQIPSAPCITTTVHGPHLDPPSEDVRAGIKEAEQALLAVPEHELAAVGQRGKGPHGAKGSFRRNKAKGPNPLAVQKKKKGGKAGVGNQQTAAAGRRGGGQAAAGRAAAGGAAAGGTAAGDKKRRKRHKGSQQAGAVGAAAAAGGDSGS